MSAGPRYSLDFVQAIEDHVNARRDVRRREDDLKAARRENRPSAVASALSALNSAQGKAQAAGRLLDAAVDQEAQERA